MDDNFLIYEDPLIRMHLSENPVVRGHIEIRPVQEAKTLQELDDGIVEHLFFGASYAATALFELVGAQGTNILLTESEDQLCINVLARSENDGIDLMWPPTKGNPAEIQEAASKIKDKADVLLYRRDNPDGDKPSSPSAPPPSISPSQVIKEEEGKENYLLKSLNRIP